MSDLHAFTVDLSRPHSVPWLQFELPVPPSVNQFMKHMGNRSPAVHRWTAQADMAFMASRVKRAKILGKFEAEFLFGRDKSDFHNREKALFDWLEMREFIENDKLCEWRASGWGDDVPKGRVVVRIRPWWRS